MLIVEIALIYLIILFLKSISALRYVKTFRMSKNAIPLDSIAIFQPILSGDPTLKQTIEANIRSLKGATFYWLVDDDDDTAHAIVDSLIKRHSDVEIWKYSYPPAPEGINPKLFKLNKAITNCKHTYCVVLDDDTTLPYTSLQSLVSELKQCTLATGLPQYTPGGNFPSALLAAFVNNNASMTYLSTLMFMKAITINGMCYAFKREEFLHLGGFKYLLHHLTDDLAVARMVLKQGGTIHQIPDRQIIRTHVENISAYFQQMHRWYVFANLLFTQQPSRIKLLLIILHGVPPLLLAVIIGSCILFPTWIHTVVLICTIAFRYFIISQHSGQYDICDMRSMTLSILSEFLQNIHYIHALLCRRIRWRNRTYTVYDSDRFESV